MRMIDMDVREKALAQLKKKIKKELSSRDNLIIHALRMYDTLIKCFNLIYIQTFDWYSVNFPELCKKVDDPETFLRLVSKYGERKNFANLKEYKEIVDKSLGIDLAEKDIKVIQKMAEFGLEIKSKSLELEKYIEELMVEEAPNLTAITGPIVGARLIEKAGGLKRLSKMPASTIQVLGAEKALFAHLRKKVPAPKHGVIFLIPEIRKAQKKARGKIARKYANKIAIAARLDYFGKEKSKENLEKE
ncbi:MAG: hypothetical protein QW735_02150 [archaeon]